MLRAVLLIFDQIHQYIYKIPMIKEETIVCKSADYTITVRLIDSTLIFRAENDAKLYEGRLIEDAMQESNKVCFGSCRILFLALKEAVEAQPAVFHQSSSQLAFKCVVKVAGHDVIRQIPIEMKQIEKEEEKAEQQKDHPMDMDSVMQELFRLRKFAQQMERTVKDLRQENHQLHTRISKIQKSIPNNSFTKAVFDIDPRTKYFGKFKFNDNKINTFWDGILSGSCYPLFSRNPIRGRQFIELEFGSIHNHTYVGIATRAIKDGYDCWKEKESVCIGFMDPCIVSINGKQFQLSCKVYEGNKIRINVDLENLTIEWERIFPNIETLAKVQLPKELKDVHFVVHLCSQSSAKDYVRLI